MVEDEFHFIVKCNLYNSTRKTLYDAMFSIWPHLQALNDYEKFIWMMASRNVKVYTALATYVANATEVRKQYC